MGKRQTRIFRKDFPGQLDKLAGKEANVLLNNHATFHGVILGADSHSLLCKDLRQKKHTIPLAQIEEIMLDRETEY